MGFTSCPPKPRIGYTKGTMSRTGCVSFFKQSQAMMSTELPVSTRIRRTIALVIFSRRPGAIMGRSESRSLLSTRYHCGRRQTRSLLRSKHLLCVSELSFPSQPSYSFRVTPCYFGHDFYRALLIPRQGWSELLFSSEELWSSVQKSVDLTLVCQFVKGFL